MLFAVGVVCAAFVVAAEVELACASTKGVVLVTPVIVVGGERSVRRLYLKVCWVRRLINLKMRKRRRFDNSSRKMADIKILQKNQALTFTRSRENDLTPSGYIEHTVIGAKYISFFFIAFVGGYFVKT